MNVYIVFGSTGEYSDHTEWVVKVFQSRRIAEKFVELNNEWVKKLEDKMKRDGIERYDLDLYGEHRNPHDDKFKYDYTGTTYFLKEAWMEV